MDDVLRPSAENRHIERFENEVGTQMIGHRPTKDAPAVRIKDHGQIQKAAPGRDVRDVGDPQLIRFISAKLPIHEIWCRASISIADRRNRAFTTRGPGNMTFSHQASDAFARNGDTFFAQLDLNPRTTVCRA